MQDIFIDTLTSGSITEQQYEAVCQLHYTVFADRYENVEAVKRKKRVMWMPEQPPAELATIVPLQRKVIWEGERAIANAGTYARVIGTERGDLPVLTMMDVSTAPDRRGLKLGERIVGAVLDRVDRGDYVFCLFQTGEAKGFYEKLGARAVDNIFVDSTGHSVQTPGAAGGPDSPWAEPNVMVYPATGDWPSGEIDLRGPGW